MNFHSTFMYVSKAFILTLLFLNMNPQSQASSLSLVGATVITGTGRAPLPDRVINIKDGRIVGLGPRTSLRPLAGARVIEARGKWVLPGLIDAHVHFFQSGGLYTRPDVIDLRHVRSYREEQAWIRKRLPRTLSSYLCSGITSVADVGGPYWTIELAKSSHRRSSSAGSPGIWAAGPLLSNYMPAEFAEEEERDIIQLTSTHQARALVRQIADRGAAFIKLWMIDVGNLQRTMPAFQAAIDEAHKKGLRVFAHATELKTAKMAVRSGIDVLVHAIDDRPVDEELITLLRRGKVITISTLAVDQGYDQVLSGTASLSAIMRKCGDPEVMRTWNEMPRRLLRRPRRENPMPARNLLRLVQEGLVVAAGSDAGNIGTLHGPGLHQELELLVKAGLTPEQVIMAATKNAAQVLSTQAELGTVEVGKQADLILVGKDPLQDVRHLGEIDYVIRAGQIVP